MNNQDEKELKIVYRLFFISAAIFFSIALFVFFADLKEINIVVEKAMAFSIILSFISMMVSAMYSIYLEE